MRNTHSFNFFTKKFDFQSEDDYKDKYVEDELEITKQKQQLSNYVKESFLQVKDLDRNEEEEQDFLNMDGRKKKRRNIKNPQFYVSGSVADIQSQRIKYPKYSSPILPYQSPIKTRSPSKRFRSSMDYLDQELQKQNYYSNKNNTDSEIDIFDFSDNLSSTDRI